MFYLHTNQNNFGHIKYSHPSRPNATVATSGCGPCSALMIVENMTDTRYKMQDWINWVLSTGARVSSGTEMNILSAAMAKKFGFTVTKTNSETELKNHLMKGGMAIGNCGGAHGNWKGLFSTAGHFFTIIGYTNDGYFIVLDPNWTKNKFTNQANSLSKWRSQHAKQGSGTEVYVSESNLNEDTCTRNPSYYLFSLPSKPAAPKPETNYKEEMEDDEVIYKNLNEVPAWYLEAVQRRTIAGACDGKNIPESLARGWTVDDRMNPIYNNVDQVPSWGKATVTKLVEKGFLKGTGPGLDITHEMLRLLVIQDRAGLFDK